MTSFKLRQQKAIKVYFVFDLYLLLQTRIYQVLILWACPQGCSYILLWN